MATYCGFSARRRVADGLEAFQGLWSAGAVAVVRGLDSERNPERVANTLERARARVAQADGLAVLSALWLRDEAVADCFTGFDELWLFSTDRHLEQLLTVPPITTDMFNFAVEAPIEVARCFDAADGILALADGDGLNWATSDLLLAERMRNLTQE